MPIPFLASLAKRTGCLANDWRPLVAGSLFALTALPMLASAGVINDYSGAVVNLHASTEVGFLGSAGTTLLSSAHDLQATSGLGTVSASASASQSPFDGDGTANGLGAVSFTVGGAGEQDSYSLEMSGMASALTALAAPGETANAVVRFNLQFSFRLGSSGVGGGVGGGAPADVLAGTLTLNALRTALPYESFSFKVMKNTHFTLFTQNPGDAGTTLDLLEGNGYQGILSYEMQVPYGIDPPISLNLSGSTTLAPSAVPEPGSAALLLLGLGGMAWGRRRTQP